MSNRRADQAQARQYADQLDKMFENARRWRASNPTARAQVQFNFPESVAIIAPISEALRTKIVSANAEGLDLLKALWPWDVATEATVLMCRAVLEHEPTDSSGTYQVPRCACPTCGHMLTAASATCVQAPSPPKPGDLTICISCAEILTYGADLDLARAPAAELASLDDRTAAWLAHVQQLIRERRRRYEQ